MGRHFMIDKKVRRVNSNMRVMNVRKTGLGTKALGVKKYTNEQLFSTLLCS